MTKNYLQGKLTAGSGINIDSANNISVTPATTSAIGGVKVGNGLEVKEDGTLNVTQNFTVISSVTPDAGGTISPAGINIMSRGSDMTFTITPTSEYSIASITDNGVPKGNTSPYILGNIQEDHNIVATFETFTITASAGTGGSISDAGTKNYPRGATPTYTITADEGYIIENVLVNGAPVGAVSSYTFPAISTTNQTISVTFKQVFYLFKNGNYQNGITVHDEFWKGPGAGGTGTYSISDNMITLSASGNPHSSQHAAIEIITSNKIDVTNYSKICINVVDYSGLHGQIDLGYTDWNPYGTANRFALTLFSNAGISYLDISGWTGEYYMAIEALTKNNQGTTLKISEWWLE